MDKKTLHLINRMLLGLVMLVPGFMKLFAMITGETFVVDMLAGIGFPAAVFFAWVLAIGEIFAGGAILAKWKMEYGAWIAIIVLVVASFTVHLVDIGNLLVHLALASNYAFLAFMGHKK